MVPSRLAEAIIDLDAIAANTRLVKAHTNAELMAVVTADGYGHGAVQVARTALAHGATWLGVSFTAEALALRAAGIYAPILAWTPLPDEDFAAAVRAEIDLSVSSSAQLDRIAASAERVGRVAEIHLKVDTGLHHDGAQLASWPGLVDAAAELEERGLVHVRGIWSHLAHPEEPDHRTTAVQIEAFDAAVRQAEAGGLDCRILHLANSAAALTAPRTHYDLVRVGSGLYGIEPVVGQSFGLTPAMTLQARVIMTRRVVAGEAVPFGDAFNVYTATEPVNLALLPLGFADGLPRAASGNAQVLIAGARRSVAGRITMNATVVDAGSADAGIGEVAVLFGPGTSDEPTVTQWASWAGTNPQEVLTAVGPRVPRRYVPDVQDIEIEIEDVSGDESAKRRIIVLFGGPGGEYDVSCASAAVIVGNLDRERYHVQPMRISPDGQWIPGPERWPAGSCTAEELVNATPAPLVHSRLDRMHALELLAAVDVVIPALHGQFGEDGTVQAFMDAIGVCYVGCGMAASALGMDKDAAKRVLSTYGVPVAEWAALRHDGDHLSDADRERLGLPVFVKPARSGSSVGVSKVTDWDDLDAAVAGARKWDEKVLVEQGVIGREVEVALIQGPDGRLDAAPIVEIALAAGHELYDYAAKYQDKQASRILLPAPLDPEVTAELVRLAKSAFELLGCRGLARVDFFLRDGVEPVFNEINTFPGFTQTSLYPLMWAEAGVPLPRLLDLLIEGALVQAPA